MTASAAALPTCALCDRQGLPILPVRYAIARADLGHAPPLLPEFGAGVADIPLPDGIAHYTLRLLRPGYLYVYDEHRNEWSGYVVNSQSYLWAFDIHARTPPAVDNTIQFNAVCRGKSDPYIARCIMVKNAARATKVWLGFSDVAWTAAVLARHASAEYRQAHMQCIDIAAWRSGRWQPHMASFDRLSSVAEFAADGAALQRETRAYVKRFFPEPFTTPEDITGIHPQTRVALKTLSPMIANLLAGATGTPTTQGALVTAAWAFSPHTLHVAREETQAMTAWGNQAAQAYRPAIAGLTDPAGIAMELNGLAIQRSVEFTDDTSRKWKYETAQLIAGLKEAVGHGAVKAEKEKKAAWEVGLLAGADGGVYAMTPQGQQFMDQVQRDDDADVDAHSDTIAEEAWDNDYRDRIHATAWETYLGTDTQEGTYQKELDGFAERTLQPLDTSYVAWLKSQALQGYLAHNFDPQDVRTGEAYLDVVRLLIAEASGRSAVFKLLAELVQQDPRHPDAWLMRALGLNHDPLIQAWSTAALDKASEPAFSLAELADTFHDQYKDIVGDAIEAAAGQPPGTTFADKVARLVYQICGPLTLQISKDIDKGIAGLAAKLPTRFHMGVLGTVAKVGNPSMMVVDLRGMWHRKDAARTLAGMLAKLSGGDAHAYRSGVRTALDTLADADGTPRPYHGVMLIDTAKARMLAGVSKAQRSAAISELLTPEQFDDIMQESVGKLGNLDVKTGVVQFVLSAITLANAYREMMEAKPDDAFAKKVNFAAGVIGIVGGVSFTVGKGLEKTAWGASRLAKQYRFLAIEIETRAGWLTATGKLFGAVGGVIAGVFAIRDGMELWENHPALSFLCITAGSASILIAVLPILILDISALALGIAGLIVVIILAVVACLKPNAVQDWLERAMYFGIGAQKFDSPLTQLQALQALQQGG